MRDERLCKNLESLERMNVWVLVVQANHETDGDQVTGIVKMVKERPAVGMRILRSKS
jgi:hypothetical protein